jgi:hypothetical protein
MTYNVGYPGPCLEQAQECPEVVFINRCTFVEYLSTADYGPDSHSF